MRQAERSAHSREARNPLPANKMQRPDRKVWTHDSIETPSQQSTLEFSIQTIDFANGISRMEFCEWDLTN